jgi:hypothetical protein
VTQDPVQLEFIRMLKESIAQRLKPLLRQKEKREKKKQLAQRIKQAKKQNLEAIAEELIREEAELEQDEQSQSGEDSIMRGNLGARINAGWSILRKAENHILAAIPAALDIFELDQWKTLIDVAKTHEKQLTAKLLNGEILRKRRYVAELSNEAMKGQKRPAYIMDDKNTGGIHGKVYGKTTSVLARN